MIARPLKTTRALTLVEMVVSVTIVSVMLVAALYTVGVSKLQTNVLDDRARGEELAAELLAEIQRKDYADPETYPNLSYTILVTGSWVSVSLGPDTGETATGDRTLFDDIDDYTGWTASPPQDPNGREPNGLTGWTRSVTVELLKDNNLAVMASKDYGFKRIIVEASRDGVLQGRAVALRAVDPVPTEACCLPDDSCLMMIPDDCNDLGGTSGGPYSNCYNSDCAAATDRYVAHWTMDEGSGTTITDEVSGLVGTLHDATWTGSGKYGSALEFNGSSAYVEIPHDDSLLLDEGTFAFWFNADTLPYRVGLFSKDSQYFDTGGHAFIYLQSSKIRARLQSTTSEVILESSAVVTSRWYHVAFTFGPDGMKLYLDGVLVDSDSYTGGMGTTSGGAGNYEPIALGASNWASGDLVITPVEDYFDGMIDEFRVYDYALDASEIATVMANGDP